MFVLFLQELCEPTKRLAEDTGTREEAERETDAQEKDQDGWVDYVNYKNTKRLKIHMAQ